MNPIIINRRQEIREFVSRISEKLEAGAFPETRERSLALEEVKGQESPKAEGASIEHYGAIASDDGAISIVGYGKGKKKSEMGAWKPGDDWRFFNKKVLRQTYFYKNPLAIARVRVALNQDDLLAAARELKSRFDSPRSQIGERLNYHIDYLESL